MALSLTLDADFRIFLEFGYRHHFSAAGLAIAAHSLDSGAAQALWVPPGTGSIQLKPLQMQPDFLNSQAQLDTGCVLRLADFVTNLHDVIDHRIYEINIGNTGNPWIQHNPATNVNTLPWTQVPFGGGATVPFRALDGLPPFPTDLQAIADASEV